MGGSVSLADIIQEQTFKSLPDSRVENRCVPFSLKVKGEVSDLRSAIEMLLVPGLSPLVQIAQSSEGVRVSGFTKNMKHAAKKPESCQFVEGTLQGLLDSAESLQPHRVEKLQCLHGDAVACEYRITPI